MNSISLRLCCGLATLHQETVANSERSFRFQIVQPFTSCTLLHLFQTLETSTREAPFRENSEGVIMPPHDLTIGRGLKIYPEEWAFSQAIS